MEEFVLTNAIRRIDASAARPALVEPLPVSTAALDALPQSVLVTDADLTGSGPRIVYANPAFTRMTGWSVENILGRSPFTLHGVDTDHAILPAIRDRLAADQTWQGTAVNYRADGTAFTVEWSIAPFPGAPSPTTHFIAVPRDVTQRNETERALQAALAARDEAERAQTDFVALMTHELREPLCAMVVLADLVEAQAGEVSRHLRQVGNNLVANLDLILDYTRSSAGDLELDMVDVDLRFVLESCVRFLGQLARDSHVHLCLLDGPPALIIADDLRLRQIFTSLIDNAIKCASGGSMVRVLLIEQAGCYQVTVCDDGARRGQDPGAPTPSPPWGGLGLDLAIARRFIEMHCGSISQASIAQAGTLVTVQLPCTPPASNLSIRRHKSHGLNLLKDEDPHAIHPVDPT
jgi:PAS domain S-box-containing protein